MNNKKEFLKRLQSISRSRSIHNTFSDWLEIAATSMHQLPYHSGELEKDEDFYRLEAKYMERIKSYSKDELTVFFELLWLITVTYHNSYGDFLGEVAGEENLLNKHSGQFFTPYHLCRAIAKMSFGNVEAQVKEKGIITVCEPAVGAGALVIASAEEVASQGIDPRAHLQFDCTDISRDAFNMAYIQLSALGLQAVVRHGNTLSNEYWESRPTPQLRLFDCWLQAKRREQQVKKMIALLTGLPAPKSEEPAAIAAEAIPNEPSSETLFDLEPFAAPKLSKSRASRRADVHLGEQMELFG